MTLQGNLDALVPDFVAGNWLWYPVEGRPYISVAPDVMVALGRPKGDRRSYLQGQEDNIAPQVVFEIASPSNTRTELEDTKLTFYQDCGVEEYYIYDPDRVQLKGWQRQEGQLQAIASMLGWVSPCLGIRFDVTDNDLKLYFPDGKPFSSYVELVERVDRAEARAAQLAARLQELGIDPNEI